MGLDVSPESIPVHISARDFIVKIDQHVSIFLLLLFPLSPTALPVFFDFPYYAISVTLGRERDFR